MAADCLFLSEHITNFAFEYFLQYDARIFSTLKVMHLQIFLHIQLTAHAEAMKSHGIALPEHLQFANMAMLILSLILALLFGFYIARVSGES